MKYNMDNSIEERAKDFALEVSSYMYCGNCDTCEKCKDYRLYVDIATSQKAIDIDKACEWLRNNWREYIYRDRDGMILFGHWESNFRKAMEE